METEKYSYACPDTSLPMSEKRQPSFGAKMGRHIWGSYWSNNSNIGLGQHDNIMYLREVAHGGQNLESVKNYLGYVGESGHGFTYFDLGVLNFVTRIVEKAKDELRKIDYDIFVDAIDPLSLQEKKQFETSARMVMALKDVIQAYGKDYQALMPEFPEGWKPSSTQELEVFLQTNNYKIQDEIKAETSINSDLKWENWAHVRNMMYDDWLCAGAAFCRVYKDHNGRRRVRYVPLERSIPGRVSDEAYENLSSFGEIRYITEEQFRDESAAYFTKAEQDKIVEEQGSYNGYGKYDKLDSWIGGWYNDGKKYLAVMDFEYLAPDRKVWIKSKDKKGKNFYNLKADDYEIGWYKDPKGERVFDQNRYDEDVKKFQNGEKEMINDSRVSCYGGTYIIGTDYCYNYDLLESDKYVSLGYVGYAPNMRGGKVTPLVKQLMEPAEMIQIVHNKKKEIYGKGWDGFIKIDHSKLIDISMGKAGEGAWTPKKVLEFLLEKKVLVHNAESNGNSGSAMEILPSGVEMEQYAKELWDQVQIMVTISGIDPRIQTGTNISAESMKEQNEATRGALGYLYHAYQTVYGNVGKLLLRFTPEFHNNWEYMRQFVVGSTRTTTPQEWADFKMRMNKYASVPMEQGGLTAGDEAILESIKNLKLARFVLAYFVKRNMEQAQFRKQEDMKLQGQLNDQNAQNATQLKLTEMNADTEGKIKLESFKHQAKMEQIAAEGEKEVMVEKVRLQGVFMATKQQGTDSIIKELTKANNNKEVTELKNQNDRLLKSAEMYNDHSIHESEKAHEHEIVEKEAKLKPKPVTKTK